jgi:3',5'-cyclic AMP phosphodiesterase CpdA
MSWCSIEERPLFSTSGDVYYAGFPEEFKKISDKIKELRKKVPSLRYYTIPGNHDFYTNGGPFYASLNDYNDK